MRKIITGTTLVLTAALLTGCGSEGKEAAAKPTSATTATAGHTTGNGKSQPNTGGGEVKHEVTLEVLGTGQSQVYYNLQTNKMEQVTLPWKKTGTITLTTEAEKKIGESVSVVPGSVHGSDGMLHAAGCVITVDGKKVADNQDGKADTKICQYLVK
ncbi:hypothetical protein ACFWBF_25765 [Streptomyces sp. NPDC060028]|uniref:hypothetical protein n=1 Tax=Streptomyces sp. NPDC060028 TaxID=3347041 RepID=UPI0036B1F4D6